MAFAYVIHSQLQLPYRFGLQSYVTLNCIAFVPTGRLAFLMLTNVKDPIELSSAS